MTYLLLGQDIHYGRERYHCATPWRHLGFILASIDKPVFQARQANHIRATFITSVGEVLRNDICSDVFIQANGAIPRHRTLLFLPWHIVRGPIRCLLQWLRCWQW
jgi:hypothetical protein